MDGTVAIHTGIRGHYEYDKVSLDKPNPVVIQLLTDLTHYDDIMPYAKREILFVTGRPNIDDVREDTIDWITWHMSPVAAMMDANFTGVSLFMRKAYLPNGDRDFRPDYIIKEEIYNDHIRGHYDVDFCLDDRDQVVKFWRSIGLTCFQVADGNF